MRYKTKQINGEKKQLHRVVFEDAYGITIPNGFVIHHIDGNPLNNSIFNLQMMKIEDHNALHKTKSDANLEHRQWREDNKQYLKDYKKAWRERNRDHYNEYMREWQKQNKLLK